MVWTPGRVAALGVAVAAVAGAASLARAAAGVPTAIGARRGALRAAADGSAHQRDGFFHNTEPPTGGSDTRTILRALLARGEIGTPAGPVPLAPVHVPARAAPLAVTWFGHSSALIEIDGRRVLVDPMWGERASPSRRVGPRRLHAAPVALSALPPVDAVLLSHDHYDHLDLPTVRALARGTGAVFVVPLGLGAHLRRWGVPGERVVELDWGARVEIAGLALHCAQARHFSGRALVRNMTLWSSWAILGPRSRVYFGGDTGYTPAFARTGAELGPFDLVLLPVGAYSHHWPDVHMDPEQTVRAHADLRGDVLLPVHWATFNLAFHGWSEPVERVVAAGDAAGIRLVVPRPGERVDLAVRPELRDWWTEVGSAGVSVPASDPARRGGLRIPLAGLFRFGSVPSVDTTHPGFDNVRGID
ncbi:MBL fold metallo-hydrolase [Pseudonocardia sp.]|uniref:MBL fold metallo-hydrolase n=1 Tax=Pseudonocardia sp. TaxID=60912 RepID=UPI003D10FDB2